MTIHAHTLRVPVIVTNMFKETLAAGHLNAKAFWSRVGGAALATVTREIADDMIRQHEKGLAAFSEEAYQSLMTESEPQVMFFLEDICQHLSEQEMAALAYHEEGHYVHGHLKGKAKSGKTGPTIVAIGRFELEADAYAVERVGKKAMRSALIKAMYHTFRDLIGLPKPVAKVMIGLNIILSPIMIRRLLALI